MKAISDWPSPTRLQLLTRLTSRPSYSIFLKQQYKLTVHHQRIGITNA